jgi:hypothetical protein
VSYSILMEILDASAWEQVGRGDTWTFTALTGKVRTIVIVACDIAEIAKANSWQDGNLFCCEIAKASQSYVFASTALQSTGGYAIPGVGIPINFIDEFEGDVFRWAPDGSCRQVDNAYISRWMMNVKMGKTPQD